MEPIRITAAEFKQAVTLDPAWASKLTEPVEITDFCDMRSSGITHLSAHLTFAGKNGHGIAADFSRCKNLESAEGTYHGLVSFSSSGVREIGKLEVTQPNQNGVAATFDGCANLKTARGKYAGAAFFTASGVENITDLETTAVTSPRNPEKTLGADFCGCTRLDPSKLKPEWNTAPNILAHYFAKLIHKLDTLAERLCDIGEQCIAKGEHLEKSGNDQFRKTASDLQQSADRNIHDGAQRIAKAWQDLCDFVNDAIEHGGATAIVKLLERQIDQPKKRQTKKIESDMEFR